MAAKTYTKKVTKVTVKDGKVDKSLKVESDEAPEKSNPDTPRDVRDSPSPQP